MYSKGLMIYKIAVTTFILFFINPSVAEVNPEEVISAITEDIIREIKQRPELAKGNLGSINELVDEKVMPILDFKKMTALAVGKQGRNATEPQKDRLMEVFRQLLLLSYSGTIKFAEQAKVNILPPRRKSGGKNVIVKTKVSVPGRQAVPVNYRMKLTKDGWKIYDLNVLGLWLVDNYRVQFSKIVNSKGIDGLIEDIDKKNRKLMSKSNS